MGGGCHGVKSIWPTVSCLHTVVCPDSAKASRPKGGESRPCSFEAIRGIAIEGISYQRDLYVR